MNHTNLSSAQTPVLSIALVNYKTQEMTKICLDLLRQHLGNSNVPVWVVDNYSADESTEYLRQLDWINLIERTAVAPEVGHIAHGRALDMILDRINTKYLLLLHTDTFIFDKNVFSMLLSKCQDEAIVAAVGCVEQIDRGYLRSAWRLSSRFCKHHFRRLKLAWGLASKQPKPYREIYLKSFCTLWNAKLMKQHDLHFLMDERVPGYELQDRMVALGYTIKFLWPRKIFAYLDHIQSGTVSAAGGYGANHRRTKMYEKILERLNKNNK
ncbi:glycosyltransferase [Pseudomonas sp. TMP9]|uniref:glycosyltransferase n=1 Tax=Pseudomonas sp. TMP9 TaxID=3133144 RepID=UPI0030CBD754